MLFEELQVDVTGSSDVEFLDSDRTRTPAWLIRLACAAHAGAASLAECRDLCEWFGVERRRATIQHWYQAYADYYEQDFTAQPDRVAVDEKQIQLGNEEKAWLYASINVDSKVVHGARLSKHRGLDPAEQFLEELKEKHRVADAEFLVDGMGYLTALARTNLSGDLNYTDRNIVEKLFQTYTMRIERFHETWNGSQASAERWLTAYTAYYNHHRSHQALDNQPPVEALTQKGSI
ncbi:IS6 family transposase [Natrinema hispanicum]|uniref:Transposase (Or an inactivated derivative) n=1 Tax=Natrinema hispanicum TaxID=392421 RepID=A0A1I0C888_9EURY|nr:IS6 family transposase [Natrinema hispanicum]SET15693.1 Transposase (or an inactivated derivative) [Natrinema hispanicum]